MWKFMVVKASAVKSVNIGHAQVIQWSSVNMYVSVSLSTKQGCMDIYLTKMWGLGLFVYVQ